MRCDIVTVREMEQQPILKAGIADRQVVVFFLRCPGMQLPQLLFGSFILGHYQPSFVTRLQAFVPEVILHRFQHRRWGTL